MRALTIAIDGPVASGKSVVGAAVARALEYNFFDTGAMYRAVTWLCLARGVPLEEEAAVTAVAACHIEVRWPAPGEGDGRQYTVEVEGEDITWALRSPEVERGVSIVAAYPGVRLALLGQQRRIAAAGRVVMVGRDVGTVVYPEAGLKVFLDARVEVRARRRYEEMRTRGQAADLEAVLSDLRRRDRIDSSRAVAPLKPAADAIILDTTRLSIPEVTEHIIALARRAGACPPTTEHESR